MYKYKPIAFSPFSFPSLPIDQAWGQEGWILAKFFFAFFRLQDEVEVDKNAKKNPAILTEQAWSKKD